MHVQMRATAKRNAKVSSEMCKRERANGNVKQATSKATKQQILPNIIKM